MEAAVLVPVLGVVLALMLEPCCALYTRQVMWAAASEGLRVAATAPDGSLEDRVSSYVLRRLRAVPEVSVFHVGGRADWDVSVSREEGGEVRVGVSGHLRPLPLAGVAMGALGEVDGRGLVLRVEVRQDLRQEWIAGDYGSWVGVWS